MSVDFKRTYLVPVGALLWLIGGVARETSLQLAARGEADDLGQAFLGGADLAAVLTLIGVPMLLVGLYLNRAEKKRAGLAPRPANPARPSLLVRLGQVLYPGFLYGVLAAVVSLILFFNRLELSPGEQGLEALRLGIDSAMRLPWFGLAMTVAGAFILTVSSRRRPSEEARDEAA